MTDVNRDRVLAKLDLSVLVKALCNKEQAAVAAVSLHSICNGHGGTPRSMPTASLTAYRASPAGSEGLWFICRNR